ncbi:AAA family ATPase [Microlunatus speluncae]|uniref:AAA family ATPase n=1 Tax=Microlunatus speluncae TaxID=2594267 RepID=UPI0013758DA7|nr:AAA family ATPase [Microlunatus speluncae]
MGTSADPSPSPSRLASRIDSSRRRRFVGRTAEVELFESALAVPAESFSVLFVYGPGGIGKSSLLDAYADAAIRAGRQPLRLDGYAVSPPTPDGLRAALADALGGSPDGFAERLGDGSDWVLLIDTFELLAPLETWLRSRFLPQLPADLLIVVAGRRAPSAEWLADPGWRDLLRVISLRGLPPDGTRRYLEIEQVPAELQQQVIRLTHGHPLALSLVVDAIRRGGATAALPASLAEDPDLVRALLNRLIDAAPSRLHLAALQVCGHARHVTEAMLRAVLPELDEGESAASAAELFTWLRGLTFVDEVAAGLRSHDLARDVLDADLRWRDPEQYGVLHRRIRAYLVDRLQTREITPADRRSAMTDLLFLVRNHPVAGAHWDWGALGRGYTDPVTEADRAGLIELTERQQGPEQAGWVAHWLRRQPESFLLFRDADATLLGFAGYLSLDRADPADRDADPGTRAMWAYAEQYGPPRPGELVKAWRFLVDRVTTDERQLQAAGTMLGAFHAQDILLRPRTAWDFIGTYTDVEFWRSFLGHMDFRHLPEADYRIGTTDYAVFGHDWRRVGIAEWIDLTAARELGEPVTEPHRRGADLVLSHEEFATAVRDALRRLSRPAELAENPLTGSALVRQATGTDQPAEAALAALVRAAIDELAADPRSEPLHRVLNRTFVRPAPTQEKAAELLDLPFSTYRRHRDRAVDAVVARLWQRELDGGGE